MIKSVNNYSVSQLFAIDSSVVYAVPRYQREYTWVKTQWENLFDDLLENDPGYFLGSIICIYRDIDFLATPQKVEVVDGQQRLTTLSLLFAAIYYFLNEYKKELNEEQKGELFNLKHKMVLKKGIDQIRVIPQIQNNNQNDYRAVLSEAEVTEDVDVPPYAGNRKIYRAYRYFQERIDDMTNGHKNQLVTLLEFLDKVSQACLVKIEVASHADAYTLFESLNNRGVPLTAIDLIKNKLLAQLESIEPGKVDNYFNNWNSLLSYLGEDYSVQERFFRQYYNAFKYELNAPFRKKGDKKKDPLGPIATRTNLIHIYEKLVSYDAKNFLEKVGIAGRQYGLFLFSHEEETLKDLAKPLRDLERIQGTPAYLLMLYLIMRRKELKLNNKQLVEIILLSVHFFVRRNLTDTPATRDLNRLFMGIVERLTGITGQRTVNLIREELIAISAPDDVFRDKLEGQIYEENAGVTRFILCALAERSMTKETWVDLWKMENKQFVWTIEHIFPQGENIPKSYVNMIANGDAKKAKEYQESHVHKLGNLTISGFNSTLGNKSFLEKRDRKDRSGRYVGYKNGLILNKDLAKAKSWSITQIDARTTKLVDQVMALFKLT